MSLSNLTKEDEFKKLIQDNTTNNGLLVVNFGASWCGPCKILAPQLEQLAQQASFKDVPFAKLMIDDEEFDEIVEDSNIGKVPTTIIYQGKTEIHRYVGASGAIDDIKKVLAQKLMESDQSEDF